MSSTMASSVTPTPTPKPPPAQGGVLEQVNPAKYNPKDPIIVFIIQASIIIIFCRLLYLPLKRMRQPRVIAEVIGGILLGPSVMGKIPGFSKAIFPVDKSHPELGPMQNLTLVANVGLVLFLFLVGLEVDLRLFASNWKVALSVGAAGMLLPFGLGCAIAYGLFNEFPNTEAAKPVNFGVYMLFIGVAMAITAFPVLCRILTELKLLGTQVGVVVLSAGVGNDVVGWILLALCVALVNAGSGLTALWVLLTCVGYVLLLAYAVRPGFMWILNRTGSLQNGPSQSIVCLTLLMTLASSFFTGIIGVHPIFGAFLIGLICPHEGGFAIKLTEKIEDLVSVLFLPLYFALSGLNTDISLLNDGITWAYVIGVITVAFAGKIIGGTLAARACSLVWRESFTIGVLMSCKGLVELIVLNIGLQAQILTTKAFTIFVVMALVTTFATTPLVATLYPPWYQKKLGAWKRGEIDWDGNVLNSHDDATDDDKSTKAEKNHELGRLLVHLRLDSLPSLFTFITLLGRRNPENPDAKTHPHKAGEVEAHDKNVAMRKKTLEVHGLRMVGLTERTSSVMKGSEVEEYTVSDPVVNAFRTFGQLNNLAVSGNVSIIPESSYAETLSGRASNQSSDLVLIPWSETGSMSEGEQTMVPGVTINRFAGAPYHQYIAEAFANAVCNTAVFINRGFGGPSRETPPSLHRTKSGLSIRSNRDMAVSPVADRSHHIFMPYFGGSDDRVALHFVLQLAQNTNVTATILYVGSKNVDSDSDISVPVAATTSPTTPQRTGASQLSPRFASNFEKTSPGVVSSPVREVDAEHEREFFNSVRTTLATSLESRIFFDTIATTRPLEEAVNRAKSELGQSPRNAGDLVIIGRAKSIGRDFASELSSLIPAGSPSSDFRKSVGEVAEAMVMGEVRASVLVIQAAGKN
ncbi:MAG: K(+)/H(+) antiporter [Piccolia ochrophora]|nr:MAG: K(+)/H(+) antiporter [Piccolia ochrophora]